MPGGTQKDKTAARHPHASADAFLSQILAKFTTFVGLATFTHIRSQIRRTSPTFAETFAKIRPDSGISNPCSRFFVRDIHDTFASTFATKSKKNPAVLRRRPTILK